MKTPAAIIDVQCPRCEQVVAKVKAWTQVTFSSEWDEHTKTDKGQITFEVFASRAEHHLAYPGSTVFLEHMCAGKPDPTRTVQL